MPFGEVNEKPMIAIGIAPCGCQVIAGCSAPCISEANQIFPRGGFDRDEWHRFHGPLYRIAINFASFTILLDGCEYLRNMWITAAGDDMLAAAGVNLVEW